ncbi:efflux RND transporter permease subunit [Congregibacter sp.]|uniref:efflux RND transporter permease subunit n=1 Tax=Congregibacter sp. TaxID=2744308 RepID=UPI003F6C387B
MKNIAQHVVEKPIYAWFVTLACLAGGLHGIENVGRLEDPAFPMATAFVITNYPGASAEEVELEVTDRVEIALQELPYVEKIISKSVPGRSEVQVDLLEEYGAEELPQIFDELRRRVSEAEMRLPPGAGQPLVEDDFGDVFGILYTVAAPDYSDSELYDMARDISTQLKRVPNVAKVDTRGVPYEAVYLEIDHSRLTRLGLSIQDLSQRIQSENQVVSAGSTVFDGRRLRISQPTPIDSVDALYNLRIGRPGSTENLRLGDIVSISRESIETPPEIIRSNGKPVFIVAVSITKGQNVVAVGEAVDKKMQEVIANLPLGVSVDAVYSQHRVVDEAISTFLKNLAISVLTVIFALCIFMGWRAGTVVGLVLLLTVLGTISIMNFAGIELQRISLGALMIAMGMLVDNGIVVAEGMVVGVRRGLKPKDAAVQSVVRTQYALLGATIIGILAFAPISLSDDNSGHFLLSLFQVIAISLLLSWFLAITVIPLIGSYLLKPVDAVDESKLYSAWYFRPYALVVRFGLHRPWVCTLFIVAITGACLWSMTLVKTSFFPTTNSPFFYVDYRLPEGTDILTTSRDIASLEKGMAEIDGILAVTSFIGRGSPRYMSTLRPEQPNPAYGRMMMRVADVRELNELMITAAEYVSAEKPDAEIEVTRAEFSPAGSSKIEARLSGPDTTVLRQLAEEVSAVYLKQNLVGLKTDWRDQSLQLVPEFNDSNAQLAGVSRNDLSRALAYNMLGVNIGLLRDDDKLVPIVARATAAERADLSGLSGKQIWSPTQRQYVPLSQIVPAFNIEPRDTTIFRRDRVRTLTAQANPQPGFNVNEVFKRVRPEVEAIVMPPGYQFEWGGEFEANEQANEATSKRMPLAFGIMFVITVLMFGALKQPIVIWLTVPMVLCGVALGLLLTDLPLTFPSFLGVLSLSGMLIKNCIVLIDEIDKRLDEGERSLATMALASLSRLRPVMLAALTTVVGMSPLLTDAFFREMAVCIMSGLLFATLLTLIAVPVFYRIALGSSLVSRAGES